jgi:hypothetical protein
LLILRYIVGRRITLEDFPRVRILASAWVIAALDEASNQAN